MDWDKGGAAMPRENYVAKQQRIGERLTRATARPPRIAESSPH